MGSADSTIAGQIRAALAQHLKRDVAKIRPEDRLREDLGLDSLAMIELLFKIEEHFDLEIPNEDLSRITTVADVADYVEEKLAAVPGGSRVAGAPAAAPPAPAPAKLETPAAKLAASAARLPAPAPKSRTTAAKPAAPRRAPAKVTPIKAAAERKGARPAAKSTAAKKKGSRRA